MRHYEPHLSAGEVATIGVLAATTKQGRSIFNYVLGLLRAIPCLRPMIVEDTNDTILLSNRVQIEIAAASSIELPVVPSQRDVRQQSALALPLDDAAGFLDTDAGALGQAFGVAFNEMVARFGPFWH
jgi:hypothetical protein